MNVGHVTPVAITHLWSSIASQIASGDELEAAAQSLAEAVYRRILSRSVHARFGGAVPSNGELV